MPHLPRPWHTWLALVLVALRTVRGQRKPADDGVAIAPSVAARTALEVVSWGAPILQTNDALLRQLEQIDR